MYAVIFKAKVKALDEEYSKTASAMRELAFLKYGCLDFVSVSEGEFEIAISYWSDEEAILKWRQNVEHKLAQAKGRQQWYESYTVEVVKVVRSYQG